jgi:glyoxalase family protein
VLPSFGIKNKITLKKNGRKKSEIQMLSQIQGLHHVTSFAGNPKNNNQFFTKVLGLRRVKKTVNFDAPDVYHLYYGDETGSPGTVMTYFPFPNIGTAQAGTGEVGNTCFSVPKGALPFWAKNLGNHGVQGLKADMLFGQDRLHFKGVDNDDFVIVEQDGDSRVPRHAPNIPEDVAIRGFHSANMRLQDDGATAELLKFMGYHQTDSTSGIKRFTREGGNAANVIDITTLHGVRAGRPGSGTVHHIAFAVENRAKQLEVRKSLMDTGFQVTPVIDRDYFYAIYFRTPGGVLFEIATNEPGFNRDEDTAHLGEALKLPSQHAHLRDYLEKHLVPLE